MKLWKTLVAGGMLALTMSLAGTQLLAQTATPAAPPPTKIAVVDIVKMFSELDEKKAGDADIEQLAKKLDAKRRELEDKIDNLKKQLSKDFKEGTVAYNEAQEELFKTAMDLDSHLRLSEQKLLMEQRLRTMALYRKMNAAIAEYAQANGIIIVFVADGVDFSGAKTPADVIGKITLRKVVYAHDTLDITRPLVAKMNTAYKPATK